MLMASLKGCLKKCECAFICFKVTANSNTNFNISKFRMYSNVNKLSFKFCGY